MPKLKGGSRAEHEVAPNASQIVSSRRPRNDLPIEEVRFAADSLLEGDGFELPVPRQILSRFESRSASHDRRFEAASPCGSLWGEVYKAS